MSIQSKAVNVVTLIVLLGAMTSPLYGVVAHDDCLNAIAVFESTPYINSSAGATGSSVSSCSYNDTADVWHSFAPLATGNYLISLCGSAFDTTLSVYDSCGGSEIDCNDDICSLQSQVIAGMTAGQTYLIRIAGYGGGTGVYSLDVTKLPDPPVNDELSGAIEVLEDVPYNGDTTGATGETFSSCAQGYDFYDVWHTFTAPATTDYSISLCNSLFDTTLSVYDDQGLELVDGCNDESCGAQSKLDITLTGGSTYSIRIAGFDGDMGIYTLNVTRNLLPPVNDECSSAIEVFLDSPYYGTSAGATGFMTSGCSWDPNRIPDDTLDVWHSFTAIETGYHTVSLCGSSFDTTLVVYDDCSGGAIACNDHMCDTQSEVTPYFTAGQTYSIRIAGNRAKTGDYVIVVSERLSQPSNDDCASAIEVFEDVTYNGSSFGALGDSNSLCSSGFDFYDVWHSFTPTVSKDYLVSLCGSDFDTTVSVYNSCDGTEIACNDDSCDMQSEVVISLTAGQTYLVRVAGYDGDMGSYSLNISGSLPAPANDDCTNAIPLDLNVPYTGTTEAATGSGASSCSDLDNLDVWFSYSPIESGTYEISLCESQFDTTLSVYDFCGGLELSCDEDSCGIQSIISMYLETGQTYLIRVAGYRGAIGSYTIVINSDCMYISDPATPYPGNLSYDVDLGTVLAWNSGSAMASQPTSTSMVTIKGIYGTDDRQDEYQVLNSQLKSIGDSTVALISSYNLTNNGDGTYSIPSTSLADSYLADYGLALCSDEPFIDQPAPAVCTGFLVAPNLIATTGHCINDSSVCTDMAFVFGFTMTGPSSPVLNFDASEVYFCNGIIARVQTADSDWALIQLDRDVTNHEPLAIRKSGIISNGQDLSVIGHTIGLPRKYADNAWVQENLLLSSFYANLDTFMGNSGSPVINMSTYEVEGILFAGNPDFVLDGDCDRSAVCPDTGCPGWEKATRVTEFSDLVPVFDVYLGTSPDPNSMQLICADTPKASCPAPTLDCGKTYYWQVIAKSNCSQKSSPVWVFSTALAGDYDNDCDVDLLDFAVLASWWQNQGCNSTNNYCSGQDIDKLGSVDFDDLLILLNHWME